MFHVHVAFDIYRLGQPLTGIAQGRMDQLAAYMLTLSLFVIGVGVLLNWRNSRVGFWLNLCVAGGGWGGWGPGSCPCRFAWPPRAPPPPPPYSSPVPLPQPRLSACS